MPNQRRPGTAKFDPVSADVYAPVRTNEGGTSKTEYIKVFNTRIIAPRAMYTWERSNQQRSDSTTTLVLATWIYGLGFIDASMYFLWRNRKYFVVGEMTRESWTDNTKAYEVRVSSNPGQEPLV